MHILNITKVEKVKKTTIPNPSQLWLKKPESRPMVLGNLRSEKNQRE
jgi:hypothetical protein